MQEPQLGMSQYYGEPDDPEYILIISFYYLFYYYDVIDWIKSFLWILWILFFIIVKMSNLCVC